MIKLEDYSLVYTITALPSILFAQMTSADQPLTFDYEKFYVPPQLTGQQVEIRIVLFNKEGTCIQMSSDMVLANSKYICQIIEVTGLKMVETLLSQNINS